MDINFTSTKLKFPKWPELRGKYVYGRASLLILATEYKGQISYNAIATRCKIEGWVQLRDEYWASMGQELGKIISAKSLETKLLAIESANWLIRKNTELIQRHMEYLESKGENLKLNEARGLLKDGFKMLTFLMDKIDKDPRYSASYYSSQEADNEVLELLSGSRPVTLENL